MRLLDAEALIYDNVAALVDFPDESLAPEYAILSHTWEEEEVLFHDIALGPQHEVQLSVASIRALRRRSPVTQPDSDTCDSSSSHDTDTDLSDEDSTESKTSPTGSSQSSDDDAFTPQHRGSSNTSNDFSYRLHTPHIKAGWNKVLNTCLQTVRDGLTYVWIDTCESPDKTIKHTLYVTLQAQAVLTRAARQSSPRRSTPCIAGMKLQLYATPI